MQLVGEVVGIAVGVAGEVGEVCQRETCFMRGMDVMGKWCKVRT